MINKHNILSVTIKRIRLHQEERMQQGAAFGTYTSNYVAEFNEYPNGIVVIDHLAATMHPDWKNKTEQRAAMLTQELHGKQFQITVQDVFDGKDCFEGKEL